MRKKGILTACGLILTMFILGVSLVIPAFDKPTGFPFFDDLIENGLLNSRDDGENNAGSVEYYNTTAYHYINYSTPSNSFGVNSFQTRTVNWSYFKQLFTSYIDYTLEYQVNNGSWQNGNEYLSIDKTWHDDGYWKINQTFNNPSHEYINARFTIVVDAVVLNYVNISGDYCYYLNYSVPDSPCDETFCCFFNWSDIASIPGLIIHKGFQDGKFYLRFRKDDVPFGSHTFDPTFGYNIETEDDYNIHAGSYAYLVGYKVYVNSTEIIENMTVRITRVDINNTLECAIYSYGGDHDPVNLIGISEQKEVTWDDADSWMVFNFTGIKPVLTTDNYYFFCIRDVTDNDGPAGTYLSISFSDDDVDEDAFYIRDAYGDTPTYTDPLTGETNSDRNFTLYASYKTDGDEDNWYNDDWGYRKLITVNHSLVSNGLYNFPMLISLDSDSDLAVHAQSDGDDIFFVSYDNASKYNHEIEYYSDDGNMVNASIWVNISFLSGGTDTYMWMYYGNSTCGFQGNSESTWNSGYVHIWHMNDTTTSTITSVVGDNEVCNKEGVNSPIQTTSRAKIGYAQEYDGSSDSITSTNFDEEDIETIGDAGGGTVSGWILWDDFSGRNGRVGYFEAEPMFSVWNEEFTVGLQTTGDENIGFNIYDDDTSTQYHLNSGLTAQTGVWYYCTVTWGSDAGGMNIYVNGTQTHTSNSNTGANPAGSAYKFIMGETYQGNDDINGVIDEIRFENTVRSDAYINTTYNTMALPSSFLSIGNEESQGTPENNAPVLSLPVYNDTTDVMPYIVSYYPNWSYVNISVPLSITVNDANGDSMDITWRSNYTGTWVTYSTDNSSCSNGTYITKKLNRFNQLNTKYWWSANVSDGTDWTNTTYSFTTGNKSIVDVYHCWGNADIGRSVTDQNIFYIFNQYMETDFIYGSTANSDSDHNPRILVFNASTGNVTDYFYPFHSESDDGSYVDTVCWPTIGYFNGQYRMQWRVETSYGSWGTDQYHYEVVNQTVEGFEFMDVSGPSNVTDVHADAGWNWGSYFNWNNTIGYHGYRDGNNIHIEKWENNAWTTFKDISETSNDPHDVTLVCVNDTLWYVYYTTTGGNGGDVIFQKSTDAGSTWGNRTDVDIDSETSNGYTKFTQLPRYGDTFFIITVGTSNIPKIYKSTDCETWTLLYSIDGAARSANLELVDEDTLLWTYSNNSQVAFGAGVGNQYIGLYDFTKLLITINESSVSYPTNDSTIDATSTYLNVTVDCNQTVDVAFYWENGSFIDVDMRVSPGETGSIYVSGLTLDTTYEWYTVATPARFEYWGEPASTSDDNQSDTFTFHTQTGAWSNSVPINSVPSPSDTATNVNIDITRLGITVSDADGNHTMNVTFYTNESGSWQVAQNTNTSVANGTYYCLNVSWIDSYSTKYWWNVSTNDGNGGWDNDTYSFATVSSLTWQDTGFSFSAGNGTVLTWQDTGFSFTGGNSSEWSSIGLSFSAGNGTVLSWSDDGFSFTGGNSSSWQSDGFSFGAGNGTSLSWSDHGLSFSAGNSSEWSSIGMSFSGGNATVLTWQDTGFSFTGGNSSEWSSIGFSFQGGNTTTWSWQSTGFSFTGDNTSKQWQNTEFSFTAGNSTGWQSIGFSFTGNNGSVAMTISNPYPENDSYINDLQPTLVFTLMNPDGAMNYSIFVGNSSSNCTTLLTNESGVLDGTFHYNNYYLANSYNTGWWWAVNASDSDSYVNTSFMFTPVRGGGGIVSTGGGVGLAVGAGIGLFGLLALVLVLSRRRKNNGYM